MGLAKAQPQLARDDLSITRVQVMTVLLAASIISVQKDVEIGFIPASILGINELRF